MGCDIHWHVEKRKGRGHRWEFATPAPPEPADFQSDGEHSDAMQEWECDLAESPLAFHRRCYNTFAALAGVRNYGDRPFAISAPRGLPWDATFESRLALQCYGPDAHNASWLTLAELKGHDWPSIRFQPGGETLLAVITEMEKLGDPDDVRAVFFFDN